jgi:hypothetical protein
VALKYKVSYEPDQTTVRLSGPIDEHIGSVMEEIRSQVKGRRLVIDCDGVGLINSIGVSVWLAHIGAYTGYDLKFVRCPYTFTSLCLIIPSLPGTGSVESLYVRYLCAKCEDRDHRLVLADRTPTLAAGRFTEVPCPKCKRVMTPEPDDADLIEVFRGAAED